MASKIEILRAVATAVGARKPIDENEGGAFLDQILPLWDSVVNDYATRHAWTWGTQTRELTATAATPPAPWQYQYDLPADRTLLRGVYDEAGYPVDYDIEDGKLNADEAGPLSVKINVAADPSVWPGDYAKIVQDTLEGYSWKGLRDEKDKGQQMIEMAKAELKGVIARDRNQKPKQKSNRGTVFQAFKDTLRRRRPLDG